MIFAGPSTTLKLFHESFGRRAFAKLYQQKRRCERARNIFCHSPAVYLHALGIGGNDYAFPHERTGERLLGIKYDEEMGGYKPAGPYVLIAQKHQALEEIYQEISSGSDACLTKSRPGTCRPELEIRLDQCLWKPAEHRYGASRRIYRGPSPATAHELKVFERSRWPFAGMLSLPVPGQVKRPRSTCLEMNDFARRYEQLWAGRGRLPD